MISTRRTSLAAIALLAVLVAAPGQASAASLVPFRATVSETFTAELCSPVPSLCVSITGRGHATHLGEVRESASVVSNLAASVGPGCFRETRRTTLTAANGDQIVLDAAGHNCVTGPTTVTAMDAYVVRGGTGHFSGASGIGTITATIDQASATAVVTFSGLLSTPD